MKKSNIKKSFGVVMPWPGIKNAEFELIERIKIASAKIGVDCIVIDTCGNILDEDQKLTNEKIDSQTIDFVLSLHFNGFKIIDSFYYGTLWNPPKYLLMPELSPDAVGNCGMYDAFISYDSKGIEKYVNVIFNQFKVDLYKDVTFTTSPPCTTFKPNLSNPKIFYCGMNWEKCLNKPTRHTTVLKDLEKTGNLKIFGPEKFMGAKPWEGYKSYSGEIPFDGVSLIKEINNCGVVIVLSSDEHKKYDIITNRLFEAAAAGAVVISEDSEFIRKEFGDSVLFIDYKCGDQNSVSEQILKHFEWIKNNKEEAIKKAKKLQKIFVDKFCMEKQLQNLFDNHEKIKKSALEKVSAKNTKEKIDVILRWNSDTFDGLEETIRQINNQYYDNMKIIVCVDNKILKECSKIINNHLNKKLQVEIIGLNVYNNAVTKDSSGYKMLLDGEVLSKGLEYSDSKYVTFIDSKTIWFSDHITTLKRTLDDNPESEIAYSGFFSKEIHENEKIFFRNLSFGKHMFEYLEYFDFRLSISSMMLKKEFLDKYKNGFFDFFDGYEFYLPAFYGLANNKSSFSYRMTSGIKHFLNKKNYHFSDAEMQIELLKILFKNNFYFKSLEVPTSLSDYKSGEFDKFKRMLLLTMKKDLTKGKPISRIFAKLFFGKKNWKMK